MFNHFFKKNSDYETMRVKQLESVSLNLKDASLNTLKCSSELQINQINNLKILNLQWINVPEQS